MEQTKGSSNNYKPNTRQPIDNDRTGVTEINSKDYVDKAEKVMGDLFTGKNKILTTSQIRKQLAMTSELLVQAERCTGDILSDKLQSKVEYLRMQFIYQAGREATVNDFVKKAGVLEILKKINESGYKKEDFLTFCRYMEALVAYRKYYGKEYNQEDR